MQVRLAKVLLQKREEDGVLPLAVPHVGAALHPFPHEADSFGVGDRMKLPFPQVMHMIVLQKVGMKHSTYYYWVIKSQTNQLHPGAS